MESAHADRAIAIERGQLIEVDGTRLRVEEVSFLEGLVAVYGHDADAPVSVASVRCVVLAATDSVNVLS